MKTTSWNTLLVGIGAILVLALVGVPIQNAEAQEDSVGVLYQLQGIQSEIDSLKENIQNFDINKLASQTFDLRLIGEKLVEIQESQNSETEGGKEISVIIDYLMTEYKETYHEYKSQLNNYEKQNALDMKQRQFYNQMAQNYIDIKTIDDQYRQKLSQQEFVKREVKKLHEESRFQDFINKIAIEQYDKGVVPRLSKNFHEVALVKIVEEENWDLTCSALDRVINQNTNPQVIQQLINYKVKAENYLEQLENAQKEKTKVFTLTKDNEANQFSFGGILELQNEILTPSIIISQLKNEIKSIVNDAQKIVEEENTRIKEIRESQRIDSHEEDSARKKSTQSESEIKVKKNGNGDGNFNGKGNSNGQGNENGKGKGVN